MQSVVHAQTDSVANVTRSHEGTVNGAGSAIDWLGRRDGARRDARAWIRSQDRGSGMRCRLLFMNGVGGLGAPYWRPDFPIEFVHDAGNDSVHADTAELASSPRSSKASHS